MTVSDQQLLTIADYEARSRDILPRALFDVLFGGPGVAGFEAETRNVQAFAETRLRPRVMAGAATRRMRTSVLGQEIAMPVVLAPAGYHQRGHPDGELASARAAHAQGTILTVSPASTYTIEEVAAASPGPLWFQLYVLKSRAVDERLIRRAEDSGYKALMITVDHLGRSREREIRYDFSRTSEHRVVHTVDPKRVLVNFAGMDLPGVPSHDNYRASFDDAFSWSDLEWVRKVTKLPLILKGIQTAEDARLCREHGVDALVVSNHGGHASPDARATLETLPEVVAAAGKGVEIYLDGGVRRGGDALKALALGARCVLVGRPIFWGLAVGGQEGLACVLDIYRSELDSAMSLCGVADVLDVDDRLVAPPTAWHADGGDLVDRLERLSRLAAAGHLSRDELAIAKERVLFTHEVPRPEVRAALSDPTSV